MAAAQLPIVYREVMNICNLGISGADVNFKNCTMESDKFICVKDTSSSAAGGKPKLKVLNLQTSAISEFPMGADSAIMNPVSQIVAVRSGGKLRTLNLELQSPMKGHTMPAGDKVTFWRWLTPKVIGFVTDTAAWLWSMDGDSAPVQAFPRDASLGGAQIIDFQISSNNKWLLLVGIRKGAAGGIDGNMQLYSVAKKVSQPLTGHAGAFADIKINGEAQARTVFAFVDKKPGQPNHTLRCMQVDKPDGAAAGAADFPRFGKNVPFPPQAQQMHDFPCALVASPKHDMHFLITKAGYMYMYFIHTGSLVYSRQLTKDTMFTTCKDTRSGGILAVTARTGQVVSISVNEQTVVKYAQNLQGEPGLALKIATVCGLSGAGDMFKQEFERLMSQQNYAGAAKLAAKTPGDDLRNADTIARFQALPTVQGQPSPLLQYFSALLECGKLNAIESIELVRPVLQQNKKHLLEKWLKEEKLSCSEELGDLVFQFNGA